MKKILLTSSLLALSACSGGIPTPFGSKDTPVIQQVDPIIVDVLPRVDPADMPIDGQDQTDDMAQGLPADDAKIIPEEGLVDETPQGLPEDTRPPAEPIVDSVFTPLPEIGEGFVDDAVEPESSDIGSGLTSLGDPSVPGLWLRTSLVSAPASLELYSEATGMSVIADVTPSEGSMQMSLAAFQALGLSPVDIVEISIRNP